MFLNPRTGRLTSWMSAMVVGRTAGTWANIHYRGSWRACGTDWVTANIPTIRVWHCSAFHAFLQDMPHYYFHVQNDTSFAADENGLELPDLTAACRQARKILGGVIADELESGRNRVHLTIMVDDHEGVRAANLKAVTSLVASESPFAD